EFETGVHDEQPKEEVHPLPDWFQQPKRFIRQSDLYSEHAYWKATLVLPLDPSPSSTTNKVEVPKEFPKVSMVEY
ncbi:hypothetical protein Tco_0501552, partial [Tanacetum coccineum]